MRFLSKKMAQIELKVKAYQCERCLHRWIPKKEQYPITCPKCKSAYWDKPRQNKEKKK